MASSLKKRLDLAQCDAKSTREGARALGFQLQLSLCVIIPLWDSVSPPVRRGDEATQEDPMFLTYLILVNLSNEKP